MLFFYPPNVLNIAFYEILNIALALCINITIYFFETMISPFMFFVISIGVLLFHKFLEMFYGAWTDGSSCEIFYQPYDLKVIN